MFINPPNKKHLHFQPQQLSPSLSMDLQLKQWRNQHESESSDQKHSSTISRFLNPPPARMGSGLSFAQWQELELQVLIFRHMQAGAPVPPHLLQPIKQSFLQLYHSPLAALDPEVGRCRRTDGKKWRCSRDAVAGQKYCERHMHRGRNRSRKPVEPFLHLNQSSPVTKNENGNMFENLNHLDVEEKSDGHVLRHFFDDWPKPEKGASSDGRRNSGTCLSMGITFSDVSLKLSTGHGEGTCHLASVGGPLAEALRSSTSTSTSSPNSVLLQLPPNSACETSFIGT